MAQHNADQVADWNGQSGERWVAHQARLDARLAVFGQAAIEAAAPATGERVLDVGCGAGASSLALAACVGAGGQVLGVDISEPLIGRARALALQDTRAPARKRVRPAASEFNRSRFGEAIRHCQRRKMMLALTPPKPNPLEIACSMGMRLASRATMSTPLGRRVRIVEIESGRRHLVP